MHKNLPLYVYIFGVSTLILTLVFQIYRLKAIKKYEEYSSISVETSEMESIREGYKVSFVSSESYAPAEFVSYNLFSTLCHNVKYGNDTNDNSYNIIEAAPSFLQENFLFPEKLSSDSLRLVNSLNVSDMGMFNLAVLEHNENVNIFAVYKGQSTQVYPIISEEKARFTSYKVLSDGSFLILLNSETSSILVKVMNVDGIPKVVDSIFVDDICILSEEADNLIVIGKNELILDVNESRISWDVSSNVVEVD